MLIIVVCVCFHSNQLDKDRVWTFGSGPRMCVGHKFIHKIIKVSQYSWVSFLKVAHCIYDCWEFLPTTSCRSPWDTVPYFGLNGLSMILCLWPPLHPLSKLLAIQEDAPNLEEQLWMEGRREISIVYYRPVTRRKKGRFFVGLSHYFCNWL